MLLRWVALATFVLLSLFVSRAARAAAWTEVHQTSGDVRMTFEPDGVATVEHTLGFHVVMGPIKSIDVVGVDREARLESGAAFTAEDGRLVPARVETAEPSPPQASRLQGTRGQVVRLTIDDPKGLKRGRYTTRLRYKLDLVAIRGLVRDGAMWHLTWTAPFAPEGYDTAKLVLDLPPAPTEPRSVKPSGEDGVLASLRRTAERDELELVRPHVSHGEAVVWEARVDPKALPRVASTELRPPPPPPPPAPSRWREVGWAAGLALVALFFGGLVGLKSRRVEAACAAANAAPRPLLPLPRAARPFFAGALLACGVGVQLLETPLWGVPLVVLAAAVATFRKPAPLAKGRGPGAWAAVSASELPRPPRVSDALDAGTHAGRTALVVVVALVAGAAIGSRFFMPSGPFFVVMDALALVPIWFTGRATQLRAERARAARGQLLAFLRALERAPSLSVSPWVRVPQGAKEPDEVRLLALPKAPISGLIGIEVGVGLAPTPTAWIPTAQILVRVHDASEASCRLTSLAVATAAGPGRRTHERVAVVPVEDATPESIRAVVAGLAAQLKDRRAADAGDGYRGPERRLPPPERQDKLRQEMPKSAA
jgi:hypothetical protein